MLTRRNVDKLCAALLHRVLKFRITLRRRQLSLAYARLGRRLGCLVLRSAFRVLCRCGALLKVRWDAAVEHGLHFDRFEQVGRAADVIWMRLRGDEIIELLDAVTFEC